jgi:hypothetical protein
MQPIIAPPRVAAIALVCALTTSIACGAPHEGRDLADSRLDLRSGSSPYVSPGCGDGEVGHDEECDPTVDGWQDVCDDHCRRTSYASCSDPSQCPGENSNCAGYTSELGEPFCADFCASDDACTALPGFRAVCNFAWCALACDEGTCPNGMKCVPDMAWLDTSGQSRGGLDVCVIATAAMPRGDDDEECDAGVEGPDDDDDD